MTWTIISNVYDSATGEASVRFNDVLDSPGAIVEVVGFKVEGDQTGHCPASKRALRAYSILQSLYMEWLEPQGQPKWRCTKNRVESFGNIATFTFALEQVSFQPTEIRISDIAVPDDANPTDRIKAAMTVLGHIIEDKIREVKGFEPRASVTSVDWIDRFL